jgi:hypothetical protein
VRFVHPYDAPSVMLMTFVDVASPPPRTLLKLRQLDRLAARPTDAAVQRIFDDKRPQRLVFVAPKDVEHKRLRLRVLAARAAAAKAACSKRRTLADPAVHKPHTPRVAEPSPAPT